jgi:peptidoglycan/LPS O-acetylase OafA/YrhL
MFMLLLTTRRRRLATLWFCAAGTIFLWFLRVRDWSHWYHTLHHSTLELSGTLQAGMFLIGAAAAVIGVKPFAGTKILPIAATIGTGIVVWLFLIGSAFSKVVNYGGLELFGVSVAFIILAIVEQRWIGSKLFAFGPLRLVGRVSYGIYLWHPFVFTMVLHFTSGWSWKAHLVTSLVVLAAVTALSWHLVERPAQRLRRRFIGVAVAEHDVPSDPYKSLKALLIGCTLVAAGITVAALLPGFTP